MTRIAPYDPNRFTSAIPHYAAGRPAYSERLIARLARETGLDERARVLDLGCGPGSLTLPLSRFAGTTIGIDPDAAMIAAGREASQAAGLAIDWRVGSSFDLAADLAPLDLVTIGRAFHWMDREATLARLDELVRPGGAVALVNTELHPVGTGTWLSAFEELRERARPLRCLLPLAQERGLGGARERADAQPVRRGRAHLRVRAARGEPR